MHELIPVKKLVATVVSNRDVGISRRKEGTTMSSRGEDIVHENQNHEYFDVKGGGRRRLRHVDGDFPSCNEKKTSRRRPQSMDERKRRRQKRTTIHQWLRPKMHEEQRRNTKIQIKE